MVARGFRAGPTTAASAATTGTIVDGELLEGRDVAQGPKDQVWQPRAAPNRPHGAVRVTAVVQEAPSRPQPGGIDVRAHGHPRKDLVHGENKVAATAVAAVTSAVAATVATPLALRGLGTPDDLPTILSYGAPRGQGEAAGKPKACPWIPPGDHQGEPTKPLRGPVRTRASSALGSFCHSCSYSYSRTGGGGK